MSEGTGPQAHHDGAEGLGGPKAVSEGILPAGDARAPCRAVLSAERAARDAERRQRDAHEAELLRRARGAEAAAGRWRNLFGRAQARWCAEQARAEWAEATARDLYALVDERSALLEACAAERVGLAARVAALEGIREWAERFLAARYWHQAPKEAEMRDLLATLAADDAEG